ncbi:MAG: DegT/DnrJ/EryC1/StrS family aminotransferase [Halobacteriovoraceae bacterium]|jgi:dTDP-4-amino-4,6-dideoxygalactose transaminase|nr:DegT/DnrJ/EryC1/StrS family aminotransferase [Halobacteriovoraceae bacterium]MBT5095862.1 DegT/DnrJ/EryC1/StrS family aminotransferase [Halobacteriovoraceae bacterium]
MIEFENLGKSNQRFFKQFQTEFNSFSNSGWYVLGERVQNFEREFAEYIGTKYCIGVASGLDALILSLKALELPKGGEVIVPANTYIATILAIINADLTPVLVEPNLDSYNISPAAVVASLGPQTCAILCVHMYGNPCEMNSLVEICKNNNLKLIEDVAQAHGSTYFEKKLGSFGNTGAFSFYPTKNLGALGDAGAIVTDDEELAKKLTALRNYGSHSKYNFEYLGMNSRLDAIQAGFLSIKLRELDSMLEHKRKLAKLYLENLNSEFIIPSEKKGLKNTYHIFPIRHPKRDLLKKFLEENGIKTEIHYPIPPHKQKCMQDRFEAEYPITEDIHQTILSLPISFGHSEDDVLKVIEALNSFAQESK